MIPKEKAQELINKMDNVVGGGNYDAKQYALIVIDEILLFIDNSDFINLYWLKYWQEVKEEIKNL